jgi:hypothetical protein
MQASRISMHCCTPMQNIALYTRVLFATSMTSCLQMAASQTTNTLRGYADLGLPSLSDGHARLNATANSTHTVGPPGQPTAAKRVALFNLNQQGNER